MAADLKKVNRIGQKSKDIVFGYVRKIQLSFPSDNTYFNIVDLVIHLILLYFYHVFNSELLTEEEQDNFLSFLAANDKIIVEYPWKLIYKACKNELSHKTFSEHVHGHKNVLLLIKYKYENDLNGECIIGGYTKTGWNKNGVVSGRSYDYNCDKDAFVFCFKSSKGYKACISNIKQDKESILDATGNHYNLYGGFGHDYIFYFSNQSLQLQSNGISNSYEQFEHGQRVLDGSNGYQITNNVQIEVFQIEISI